MGQPRQHIDLCYLYTVIYQWRWSVVCVCSSILVLGGIYCNSSPISRHSFNSHDTFTSGIMKDSAKSLAVKLISPFGCRSEFALPCPGRILFVLAINSGFSRRMLLTVINCHPVRALLFLLLLLCCRINDNVYVPESTHAILCERG